jgi:hypothetical protein
MSAFTAGVVASSLQKLRTALEGKEAKLIIQDYFHRT